MEKVPVSLLKPNPFYMHPRPYLLKFYPTSVIPSIYIISLSLTGSALPINKYPLLLLAFVKSKTEQKKKSLLTPQSLSIP